MRKLSSVPDMLLNLFLLPPVPKQYVRGRIAYLFLSKLVEHNKRPLGSRAFLGHRIEFLESQYQSCLSTMHVTTEEKELID